MGLFLRRSGMEASRSGCAGVAGVAGGSAATLPPSSTGAACRVAPALGTRFAIHPTWWWGLAVGEQIPERPPPEGLMPALDQLQEAAPGGLGVGQRVMGPAVRDRELHTEPFEADRVAEVEQLGREARGVEVGRVQALSRRPWPPA